MGDCTETRGSKSVLYPKYADQETAQANGCPPAFANNPELERMLAWGNSAAANYVGKLANVSEDRSADAPTLFPELVGTCDYYEARDADFRERNPDKEPPDYYLNYGGKYCERFSEHTFAGLSGAGQEWDIHTRMNLQLAIEMAALENKLPEDDPEAFREFAFNSHPEAYEEGGLADLPLTDLAQISLTPDLDDITSEGGIQQVLETAKGVAPEMVIDTLLSGVKQEVPGLVDPTVQASPPARQSAPGATFGEAKDMTEFHMGVKAVDLGRTQVTPDLPMPDLYPYSPAVVPR